MTDAPKILKLSLATLLTAIAVFAIMLSSEVKRAQAAPLQCTMLLLVDHEKIGKLDLPPGYYILEIADPERLTCDFVTDSFISFTQDWDGVLPKPWKMNAKESTFTRGKKADGVFTVIPSESAPVQEPITLPQSCKSTFKVRRESRIDGLKIPKGKYRITLLDEKKGFNCGKASKRFKGFLANGKVPNTWKFKRSIVTFSKKQDKTSGFGIKRYYGPPTPPE